MKRILGFVVILSTLISSSAYAYNECTHELEFRHLKRVSARAKRIAGSVFAGAFAISPLTAPLGTAVLGGAAIAATAQAVTANSLNKRGKLLPKEMKQLILIDEAMNSGSSLIVEHYTSEILFGQPVGYNYEVMASTKQRMMNDFVTSLQKENKEMNITEKDVVDAIYDLQTDKSNSLCKNNKGKIKTLSMKNFKEKIVNKIAE